jgi:hypothetical protein
MASDKDTWLARQINSAKKSLEDRPDWMKRAAHFEGSNTNPIRKADECSVDVNQHKEPSEAAEK